MAGKNDHTIKWLMPASNWQWPDLTEVWQYRSLCLQLALKDAKSLADTKFILIIPAEIDRYLEWNVREKGVSKAEITRDSIEKVMHTDEAYSKYLKDNGIG